MTRDELFSLCNQVTSQRQVVAGRHSLDATSGPVSDPVPEIIRSFREAEISENEKNSLLSLFATEEDDAGFCDDAVCITDPYADELATSADDDS